MLVENLVKKSRWPIPVKEFLIHKTTILKHPHALLKNYTPKVKINIENKKYIIKTLENAEELEDILKLRHRIYYEELLHKKTASGIDMDYFDLICDHLAVYDKAAGIFVGSYRLNASVFNNRFYSAKEFNIKNILALEGNKLELGRACIDKDYRNTLSIAMLWKGLTEYIKETKTRYLFGCSSVKTTLLDEIIPIYKYLQENHFSDETCRVHPKRKFKIKNLRRRLKKSREFDITSSPFPNKYLSSLLKFYLKVGALICGEPVIDRDFKCVDFFTLLDMQKLDKKIEDKFVKE